MDQALTVRRRVLARTWIRYVEADLAWARESRAARAWFPAEERPDARPIGDPGSRVRRLHEARERALLRFLAARAAFERARNRHRPRPELRLLVRA
jgi:hypothetical protein